MARLIKIKTLTVLSHLNKSPLLLRDKSLDVLCEGEAARRLLLLTALLYLLSHELKHLRLVSGKCFDYFFTD